MSYFTLSYYPQQNKLINSKSPSKSHGKTSFCSTEDYYTLNICNHLTSGAVGVLFLSRFSHEGHNYFFSNEWGLEFFRDEECNVLYFCSSKHGIFSIGESPSDLFIDLKSDIIDLVDLYYEAPDSSLSPDAKRLKKFLRSSITIV